MLLKKNNKNKDKNVRALINLNSKVDEIYFIYSKKLDFYIKKFNISL